MFYTIVFIGVVIFPCLPSWGASCPLRKALIMLFRDEVSKRIGIAFAVPENNVHLTLFEKGGPLASLFSCLPPGGKGDRLRWMRGKNKTLLTVELSLNAYLPHS